MSSERTDPYEAAKVVALRDLGETYSTIAERTGVPYATVRHILTGTNGWDRVLKEDWFQAYRLAERRKIQVASMELAKKALEIVEDKLDDPKVNALQAATVYGILRDKERLDAGESTQNVAVSVRVEAEGLTKLLDRLLGTLAPARNTADTSAVGRADPKSTADLPKLPAQP